MDDDGGRVSVEIDEDKVGNKVFFLMCGKESFQKVPIAIGTFKVSHIIYSFNYSDS